jgi:dephospho-CoA kinase
MLLVGLTGGLACGKTFISEELARLGCHVIHADTLGHEVIAPGAEAYPAVVQLFGSSILNSDGTIARPRLAELVFNDPAKLAELNAIVHPAVRRREEEIVNEIGKTEPDAIGIVEAAILIEAGAYERFDYLIVAECTEEQQRERALARNPALPEQDIAARLRRQMPMEQKRSFADCVINTSGAREDTLRRTQGLYTILRKRALSQNRERV